MPSFSMPSTITGSFNNSGNSSIKNWNVSNVTSMNSMFYNQSPFNTDIGNWDVGKVTNFSYMFAGSSNIRTHSFNNGGSDSIKNWNVISASNMFAMFYGAPQFNHL